MNVLLVGYLHGHGGIQRHTHWLATGLTERGHRVTVATPPLLRAGNHLLPAERSYTLAQPLRWSDILRGYPGGAARGPFDVAVVCGTGWKSMLGPLLNRRIRHRVFFEVMSGERNGMLDPRMLARLGFDAIVGQGRPVEARFRREFGWAGKSTTIPALSDPLELYGDIAPPDAPPPQPGTLRAAYFGRLAHHKGVHLLIERWDRLAPHVASLDIWGDGPEEPAIRALIAARGLGDRIALKGLYPSGREYIDVLHRYDLKLLPTFGQEGAPLVLLEAMACGLPFVANGVGGIPDYANVDCRITDGDVGTFWDATDSLAAALYSGAIDRQRLSRHYLANYSYAALADRWSAFLGGLGHA